MKRKNFFGILTVTLLSAAMFSLAGCKDNGGDTPPPPPPGPVDPSTIAAANLIAYFPFESATETMEIGDGLTFVKIDTKIAEGDKPTFPKGRRGNAYKGVDGGYAKYAVAATSKLVTLKACSSAQWVNVVQIPPAPDDGEPMIWQLNGVDDPVWGNLAFFQSRDPGFKAFYYNKDAATWKGQRGVWTSDVFNKWIHIVTTYDNTTSMFHVYVNGVDATPEGQTAWTQSEGGPPYGDLSFDTPTAFYIGGWAEKIDGTDPGAWAAYFTGMVDELRLYDKALTAKEAKDLYNAEVENINE